MGTTGVAAQPPATAAAQLRVVAVDTSSPEASDGPSVVEPSFSQGTHEKVVMDEPSLMELSLSQGMQKEVIMDETSLVESSFPQGTHEKVIIDEDLPVQEESLRQEVLRLRRKVAIMEDLIDWHKMCRINHMQPPQTILRRQKDTHCISNLD